MKKMLLLLVGMACLGMFVSCSDDPQEVVVTNMGERIEWAGTVTGSVTATSSYYDSAAINENALAILSYSDNAKGNVRSYYLEVPVIYSASSKDTTEIELYKVGNDYYDERTGEKLTVTGSLEDNEFTIASVKGYNFTFTDLKFTRM